MNNLYDWVATFAKEEDAKEFIRHNESRPLVVILGRDGKYEVYESNEDYLKW